MKHIRPWLLIGVALVVGCGVQKVQESTARVKQGRNPDEPALGFRGHQDKLEATPGGRQQNGDETSNALALAEMRSPNPSGSADEEGGRSTHSLGGEKLERRIKYTAGVDLVVKDFTRAERELEQLVKQRHGYLAHADVSGSVGAPRTGRWQVRIPVAEFDAFLTAAGQLGVPEVSRRDSEDVTAEFVDLEARLKNKREQEETLRGYLKDKKAVSQLKEILTVEQELARVRGEIEQMEGQLRMLTNLTSLTTITIALREVKNYVPPQTPTFASVIGTTFMDSLQAVMGFSKACVLLAVVLAPWVPIVMVLLVPGWLLIRRWRRVASTV